MSSRPIALVGSDTLLGREVREACAASGMPLDLELYAEEEEDVGRLTAVAGEPALVTRLNAERLAGARAIILAGARESSQRVLAMGLNRPVIDLTYTAEEDPRARLRAPLAERDLPPMPAGAVSVVAHPAATALAMVLGRLHDGCPIVRAAAHVFEPASERGQQGLEELQQQTVNLLSFKPLPKQVYDAQAAFAMLAQYGEAAPLALEAIETRIERHLATLLAPWHVPLPSLCLLHAPVFHGYTASLWVEFRQRTGLDEIRESLEGGRVEVYGPDLDPPNNVGIAGQAAVAVGGVRLDRNVPRAAWLWFAADNLRLAAENALAIAQEVL